MDRTRSPLDRLSDDVVLCLFSRAPLLSELLLSPHALLLLPGDAPLLGLELLLCLVLDLCGLQLELDKLLDLLLLNLGVLCDCLQLLH